MNDQCLRLGIKPLVFGGCLVPLLGLSWRAWTDGLGPNPVESLSHATGDWALRLLLITMAITPLRRFGGWHWLLRLRRMLGLFAFFYAVAHFAVWLWLDQGLNAEAILEDLARRPYVMLGAGALVLLVPLAVTSSSGWKRRLGPHWRRLHRLVYPAVVLALSHYIWLVKADYRLPLLYTVVFIGLLLVRAVSPRSGANRH